MSPDLAKTLWLILNPTNLLTALLAFSAILLFTGWHRLGRSIIASLAALSLLIAFLPLEDWILAPLQDRFAVPTSMPSSVTGIIVLGGSVDTRESNRTGHLTLNRRVERITSFVELAQRYPNAKLVYAGGASGEKKSEAELVKPLLLTLGIPEKRLLLETKSRDTHENAVFAQALARPKAGETWILVTSAVHMPRAVGTFRRIGWDVTPYPVDYRRLGEGDETFGRNLARGLTLLNAALREWVSLGNYYLSGRTDSFFPAPQANAP
jgi:uncharacterized SAM-binding protein YcdF (DUF218 family)